MSFWTCITARGQCTVIRGHEPDRPPRSGGASGSLPGDRATFATAVGVVLLTVFLALAPRLCRGARRSRPSGTVPSCKRRRVWLKAASPRLCCLDTLKTSRAATIWVRDALETAVLL
jgi:hypothetical protein